MSISVEITLPQAKVNAVTQKALASLDKKALPLLKKIAAQIQKDIGGVHITPVKKRQPSKLGGYMIYPGGHVPGPKGGPPNKRTGNLQNSIKVIGKNGSYSLISRSPYAIFLEKGTAKMWARPFFRKAVSKNIKVKSLGMKVSRVKVF